jgi:hypothetical protein
MLKKLGNSDRVVLLKKPFNCLEVLKLAQLLTEKWQSAQQTKSSPADSGPPSPKPPAV